MQHISLTVYYTSSAASIPYQRVCDLEKIELEAVPVANVSFSISSIQFYICVPSLARLISMAIRFSAALKYTGK